jgi:hypothetical protein
MRARRATVGAVAAPKPTRVVLELEDNGKTISGRLTPEGAPAIDFYGWLELIDKLERAAVGRAEPTEEEVQ